ncbi:MAG: putative transport system permease protein [Solirubrobacterales bacterium]|nr:putative transport system permease protein [Solirubrobacterales bacterium]
MTSLALKSLWARKVRALTTTFAVVIGVAFMAGSYVFTDTIFAAFDEIFSDSQAGTSVVVSSENLVKQQSGEVPTISADLLPRIEKTPGVRIASGAIFTPGGFFDEEGEAIGAKFAPKFISSTLPDGLESLDYVEGNPPRGPDEVSIDEGAAEEADLALGDTIQIVGRIPAKNYRLVGITKLGNTSFGGFSIAQLTLPEAQRITDKEGEFDQISIAAADGVSPPVLKARIAKEMPPSVRVETGEENAERSSDEIRDSLGFLTTILLVFAFVALFVGAFLIFNTFSITVAQRIAEFGMLRTLGASRGQILRSVLGESFVIGLVGSLLGIAFGFVIAMALKALFEAVGANLPSTGLILESRTVVVSIAVGLGITMISSLLPALRSTRVPPIAALRAEIAAPSRRRRLLNAVLAALLGLVGMAMLVIGLFGSADSDAAAGLMGAGAVFFVLAVSLFSPVLVRPLAALAGWPLERMRRLTGRLARENAQRNPGRTAITAAALMIGLALVAFVTIFAAGAKDSIATAVDDTFQGDLVIQNSDGFSPIPPGAVDAARQVPGVELVATMRATEAKLVGAGSKQRINGISRDAGDVFKLEWKQGGPATLRELRDDQAIVKESFVEAHDIGIGERFRLLSQSGNRPSFEVVGVYDTKVGLIGSALVTQAVLARDFGQTQDTIDFVRTAEGADPGEVQKRLEGVMEASFPTAEVVNQQELKEKQEEAVNQLLVLIYALLVLAIVISLFGIANTLALSIHERTRELGMLRAIGMSRRQVRTLIRYEAVITALIGAILGMALGLIFAALIAQPLKDEGFTLSYPVGQLIALLVLAGLAGVLAAIAPARRASRLDVLESLQYE